MIFGESSGSTSIAMHLVARRSWVRAHCPSSLSAAFSLPFLELLRAWNEGRRCVHGRVQGFFQRAAMESGVFVGWARKPLAHAQQIFDRVIQIFNCSPSGKGTNGTTYPPVADPVACMRKVPQVSLVKWGMHTDGKLPWPDSWDSTQWGPVTPRPKYPSLPLSFANGASKNDRRVV